MTSYRLPPRGVRPARGSKGASARRGLLRRQVSLRAAIALLAALAVMVYGGFAIVTSHKQQSQLQQTQRRYQERLQQGYMPEPDD